MSYSDLIYQESEYTYSVNIQFDIENDNKILRFIPNETTIKLMRDYFIDMSRAKSNNHARIMYGSYGTGKSHFLTVLSQLLGKKFTDGLAYHTLLARINEYDPELANDIDSYVKDSNQKPMLIVPIVFDFEDFNRCIFFSLKKKLDSIGAVVHFKSFFSQATMLLEQWESNLESKDRLLSICTKRGITLDEIHSSLEMLDPEIEAVFNEIFNDMTYGVKFVFEVSNLPEMLDQTYTAISNEYRGVLFVFDEFGRYMEDNIQRIRVKAVQDLAEYCDHSAGNFHVILVSHKEISQYTQSYSRAVATEWKKVEGRYKADSINNKQDQCLSLIRSILIKDEAVWEQYRRRFRKELDRIFADAMDFTGFLLDVSKDENPFEGGFPLHPIALFVLDRLSKKVAQNDRTFFTFLASKEEGSLYRFLVKHELDEFHFVGLDYIFDYFEPNIRAVQSDDSYGWYKGLISALAKNHTDISADMPEVKVLKAIAAIGIVNDPGALNADRRTLVSTIDCPCDILENAINALCEKKILKYSGIYARYEFFDASIFDLESMIAESSQYVTNDSVINTLNEDFVNFVLYPSSYNRTYKISRVFIPIFAVAEDLPKKSLASKYGPFYDGVVIMLLGGIDTNKEELCTISYELPRSVLVVNPNSSPLSELTRKYVAAQYLLSQKSKYAEQDPAFEKELLYRIREIAAQIETSIYNWREFINPEIYVVSGGNEWPETRTSKDLSTIASDIMYSSYPETLVVNNELLNKNAVSGSMNTAKKNAIRAMLKTGNADSYYGLAYLSPEYIAVRSVLVKNGLLSTKEDVKENALPSGSQPQKKLRDYINSILDRAKNDSINFNEIYATVKRPPYGLRDGYLSILLACFLIPYKKSLIISSHGTEQEITAELFDEIVKRPEDYSFTVTSWSQEQIAFVDSLEALFADYTDKVLLSRNRLKAIYDGMMSHYKRVSKFARTTSTFLSDQAKKYRSLLEKSYSSYSKFFFTSAKGIAGNYPGSLDAIKSSKDELDGVVDSLCRELTAFICTGLRVGGGIALSTALHSAYEEKWAQKRVRAFDYYTNSFMEYVSNITTTETDAEIITSLAKALTGIELSYWSDAHIEEFKNRVIEIFERLDSFQLSDSLQKSEIRMSLTSGDGDNKTVVFDRKELSDLSIIIKNKITSTMSNFGQSVTYDDKVQIMLAILSELMEGK